MALGTSPQIDPHRLRRHFPALQTDFAFFENAGGTQVPQAVIDASARFYREIDVQLGAPYPIAERATQAYAEAHRFANRFVNGEAVGDVVFHSSTSSNLRMLSDAYADVLEADDEVVVMRGNHESCIGPWLRLERIGVRIRWWEIDRDGDTYRIEDLRGLLTDRTRLVAFSHVSNLLGEAYPIREIVQTIHEAGARAIVDGVAYAPHHATDVQAWDVDFYVFSAYKTFGPHLSVLFGKTEAWEVLTGPNHFFISKSAFPSKFELGAAPYEGAAAWRGVGAYLHQVIGRDTDDEPTRAEIEAAWHEIAALEAPLTRRLLEYLDAKPGVRIVGPGPGQGVRVPTISFTHAHRSPPEICEAAAQAGIGIRYGHMYAYRLCQSLDIEPESGVVRVSMVHYNTVDELERLIAAFESCFD